MKQLSFEQSQSESNQSSTENQISEEKQLFNNIDQQIKDDEQNLKRLKFFDTSKSGWNEIFKLIQHINDQSSIDQVSKVKKIKKFQPKLNRQEAKRKEKMNQKSMLKQIAIDEIEKLLEEL